MKERNTTPPRWIFAFLRWFCPDHLFEEIEGDLIETFQEDYRRFGLRKAKLKLSWSIIRFFRPGIILRNKPSLHLTSLYMLSNYFKISMRIMRRNKAFSLINISGLVLGITGALLLFLWIIHEKSFDTFHRDQEQLHVAWNRATENGQINCWSTTPRVLAPTLEKEFASVEHAISYADWGSTHLFTAGETKLLKTSGVFTDAEFLQLFTFPLLKGDAKSALSEPNSIVLTENFARQLYGDKEALGETLTISQSGADFAFAVTGILQNLPPNTDYRFEYLISFNFLESIGANDMFWGNNSVQTIVKLKKGTDLSLLNEQIRDLEKKHYAEGQHIELFLYPLSKMRLHSRFENGIAAGGRIEIMRLLGMLGIFLIVIACINFINLYTARAQRRSKEIAIRKVTGAVRLSLITQFICESILMAMVAGIISLISCYFLLPYFSVLIQQTISLDLTNLNLWALFLGIVIAVGLLAGSYPAFFLSSFQPIRILKGMTMSPSGRNVLRSSLVVFQFGFALTLIVSAIVVSKQITFVQNREAGYSTEHLIHIPLSGDLNKHFIAFTNELKQRNIVVSATKTSTPLTEQWSGSTEIKWRGKDPLEKSDVQRIVIDQHIATTTKIEIIQGRDMDLERYPSDSTAVLINETALGIMNFDNPIGEIIEDGGTNWHVIGVVKDFVFTNPFQKTEPIIMFGSKAKWSLNVAYLRLNPSNTVKDNLGMLEEISKKYNPEYPFEYQFADIAYARKFNGINATLRLTTLFTSVAIFIACLGLFGLAIYMSEARMKEVGIRKVLGGSVLSITRLLSYSSLKPIILSIIIFSPLSWLSMDWWLQTFAYRTSMDLWVFVLAALSIVFVALVTVSVQIIRTANMNPVKSLRSE